jgi:transposase
MARVPTIAEEDAKRPNRERDCLVGERTRIVNRIKSTLARLGILSVVAANTIDEKLREIK